MRNNGYRPNYILVNPRPYAYNWAWNNGNQWYPQTRYWGGGFWGSFSPLQAGPFVLGPWTFPKWLFYVTENAPSFEFEDYDGLIGQDVLRNFDVYLDYAHEKIYLVPNDRFRQRWPQ